MSASPTSSLSSSARRALRAAAHHLDPVVMMGQHGLTPAVLHEIDLALTAHALIKVRAGSDEREVRDGYLTEICEKLTCESVQHLGKLFVLWRNADGAGNADKSAEQDAAAVKASNDPHVAKERGPRSKLPSERAAERANAAPAARSGGYASRGGPPSGGRGAPRGATSGGRDTATGPRWKYGETPPDAPRREGWAPKDRRGAARFGEGGDDSRRRDGPPSYGAPRGRAPATGGYAGSSGSSSGTGGSEGYRGAAPTGGRSGYGSRGGSSGGGGGGYAGDNRGGAGGGSSYGGRGGSSSYGGGQGDGAPRARWGERREPPQGGSAQGGYGNSSSGNSGGGNGFGNSGNDRGAPAPRSTYSRGNDAGGSDRAPRTGGGGGGWGNRDGVTGKPSGFSRGGAGGAGGAAPRARRRFG